MIIGVCWEVILVDKAHHFPVRRPPGRSRPVLTDNHWLKSPRVVDLLRCIYVVNNLIHVHDLGAELDDLSTLGFSHLLLRLVPKVQQVAEQGRKGEYVVLNCVVHVLDGGVVGL